MIGRALGASDDSSKRPRVKNEKRVSKPVALSMLIVLLLSSSVGVVLSFFRARKDQHWGPSDESGFEVVSPNDTADDSNSSSSSSQLLGEEYKPHILFVVMDDLGYGDLGIRGSGISTPTCDELARRGLQLKNYYVLPSCTPTRVCLMSGRYPYASGIYTSTVPRSTFGLPLGDETLAQVMKRAGYQTHGVGKWHLGHASWEQTPTFRGFQSWYGVPVNNDYYTQEATKEAGLYQLRYEKEEYCGQGCSQLVNEAGNYTTTILGKRAARIVKEYDESKGPLFLYLAFTAVHKPIQAPPKYINKYQNQSWGYQRKAYAGMLTAADDAIEEVMNALKERLWDNTLIVFTTDNGAVLDGCASTANETVCGPLGSNKPFYGGKLTVWEGGVRGEGFLSGPALKKLEIPQGSNFDHLMHATDWLPTLADMLGVCPKNEDRLDGKSQLDGLKRPNSTDPARNELFLGYTIVKRDFTHKASAYRTQMWKVLHEKRKGYSLFNLNADQGEKKNLKDKYPTLFRALVTRMKKHQGHHAKPLLNAAGSNCSHFVTETTPWNKTKQALGSWCY